MKKIVQFVLERTTPGAARYQEVGEKGQPRRRDSEGAVVSTLYLRKAALNGEVPKKLTVIIEG